MASALGIAVTSLILAIGVSIHNHVFAHAKKLKISAKVIHKLKHDNPTLSDAALKAGVRAYDHLRLQGKDKRHLLTLVNFNLPSNQKRLWVMNMFTGQTLFFTYVAHGERSGLNQSEYFSNAIGSHESSLGVYLTGCTYYGVDGYSLRLHGLDQGFNNNVFKRDIVMHPAWYVSKKFAKQHGRLGRTYGCFGLNKKIAKKIITLIKNGTVLVAYYPDPLWLATSHYEQPIKMA